MGTAARAVERHVRRGRPRVAPALRRRPPRVRAGRVRRPRAARRGRGPRSARARAGDGARPTARSSAGATLDHVAVAAHRSRPRGEARSAGPRGAAARPLPAPVPRRCRRARRGQRERRAGQALEPQCRLVRQRGAAPRRPGRARACSTQLDDDDSGRRRDHALGAGVAGRAVVGRSSAPPKRTRCCAGSTSRPSRRSGSTSWSRDRERRRRAVARAGRSGP